ncbi:MAG: hypothetical protein R3B06_14095 [Kofleriaceae bacterium]
MSHPLETALNRALAIRLNLQISLSNLPIVEEWMDIHLDRFLEHLPTPPEMPPGHLVSFSAMFGSDLRRLWWGAWGDPAGMVPKLADYLKLCNIAASDAAVLDTIGEKLEPRLVGPWVGVWGGKVTTGWHFVDPQPWAKIEPLFGTHEAKFKMKQWVADTKVERIERFAQAIGDHAYSEFEFAMPGDAVDAQVDQLAAAFTHFAGAPLPAGAVELLRGAPQPGFAVAVRVRAGAIVRTAAIAPGMPLDLLDRLCAIMKTTRDDKLERQINAVTSDGVARVELGRAGDRGGVDVYVEPGEAQQAGRPAVAASTAN